MQSISYRSSVAVLLALAVSSVTGYRDDARSRADAASANRPVIGISLLTSANSFFIEMEMSMKAEAYKLGYNAEVVYGEHDADRQAAQVRAFTRRGVVAIVICPVDSRTIGSALKEAAEAEIPILSADNAVLAEGGKVISHVATDNYRGGRLAADALVEALPDGGRVAIVDHPEVQSASMRTKGFEDQLAELRKAGRAKVEVVARAAGQGGREKSRKAAEGLLASHADLEGIFAINDPSALGVLQAVDEAGRAGDVVVIGFDGQPEALEALVANRIYADVLQLPKQIARRTIQAVADHKAGVAVPREQLITPTLIRAPKAQAGLPAAAKANQTG